MNDPSSEVFPSFRRDVKRRNAVNPAAVTAAVAAVDMTVRPWARKSFVSL
jgi:hypothetical protein